MKKIKTLIVDDEPLARERLAALLSSEAGHRGRRRSAATARKRSRRSRITRRTWCSSTCRCRSMNGFEVIEAVGSERMPLVIFVTAYDQHALKAFQVRALDYILKPFDRERFTEALQRARKQIERDETGDLGRRLLALVKDLRRDQPRTDRLVVKSGGRLFFLRMDEIDWIEAAGNYVRLHVGPTSHLLRETMNAIEGRLDPEKFFRIHRSRIVNMERIQEMQPWLNGEYAVRAADRDAPDAQPRLPRKAAGTARPRAVDGTTSEQEAPREPSAPDSSAPASYFAGFANIASGIGDVELDPLVGHFGHRLAVEQSAGCASAR